MTGNVYDGIDWGEYEDTVLHRSKPRYVHGPGPPVKLRGEDEGACEFRRGGAHNSWRGCRS